MVSPEEREILEKLLLPKYAEEVKAILKKNGINPHKEQPYDTGHLSNVLKGKYNNPDIEAAFWELYEIRKAKVDKLEWLKTRHMANSQPE